ncbi:leucine-rich repeat serine/threonine-protein kinase 2-like isoform X2 [Pomacea canaliculata]|uniref:leucine-rich repeat serine/threonine-protein kinase 2-like isoform X2 n=1 Tax=Pomacea canaliculata TaxID=400727 RepID=UPI000D73DDFC|nr:leucine-rich repeat serine/threonine-protein kinase 2-like isoform X2 [Pomacea canaliculata]
MEIVEQVDSGRWSPKPGEPSHLTEAREVEHLLRTLNSSWEHDELKRSLARVEQLFPISPCQFEQNSAHRAILETMQHLRSYQDIQQMGLRLLSCFISMSEVMLEGMQQADIVQFLIRIVNDNTSECSIQINGMKIISKLTESDTVKDNMNKASKLQLIGVAAKDMATFIDNCTLHICTINALATLLMNDFELQEEFARLHLDLFLEVLHDHQGDMTVVLTCFNLLNVLSSSSSVRIRLVERGVLHQIYPCMKIWHSELSVIERCFDLLALLCREDKVSKEMTEKGVIMNTLLPDMLSRCDSTEIQLHGLDIFMLTAEKLLQSREDSGLSEDDPGYHWLKVIFTSMGRHMVHADVQEAACRALTKLMECKPDVYMKIGDSAEERQFPVHTMCLGALLMYDHHCGVFTAACNAIYYLTADNDGLCRCLMEKNSYIAILQGIKLHMGEEKAVIAGCRAIRGLCIFHDEHKEKVMTYEEDVLQLLLRVMDTYHSQPAVQSEAISIIACLADLDIVRHQCFVVRIHDRIISAIDSFPGDQVLQETAIEALAVLGGAAKGPELLFSLHAVDKIMMCMKRFLFNINIQKKGLMALQVLVDPHHLQTSAKCRELTQIIKTAMGNFISNWTVQKEAVVAMQILAERGLEGASEAKHSQMSETLIDHGCHELLFQILEKFDDSEGLHDLASECLYVIGIEQDLKSRMLVSACSKGFLSGAECLIEIGADVNADYGKGTPLYCAVKKNNPNMVYLLLKQEVRDKQTSLKLSLRQQYHEITGMLLSHMGQDKETGTLLWCGYGLQDLRPEWLLPSLASDNRKHVLSMTSKRFVMQLRKSEQRRNKRVTHSYSDSNLQELYRHKCFRFQKIGQDINRQVEQVLQIMKEKSAQKSEKTRRPHTLPKTERPKLRVKGRVIAPKGSATLLRTTETLNFPHIRIAEDDVSLYNAMIEEETPRFAYSEDEWEDWKQNTLTGANIPFSPKDPRQPQDSRNGDMPNGVIKTPKGKWLRKNSSGSFPESDATTLEFTTQSQMNSSREYISDFEYGSRRESASEDTDFDTSQEDPKTAPKKKLQGNTIASLDISSNEITSLNHLIEGSYRLTSQLTKLRELNLSSNMLHTLPEAFFKLLPELTELNLANNQLTCFPQDIVHLCNLVNLDVSCNKILALDFTEMNVGLKLQKLNLMSNKLNDFPANIHCAFPHLTHLILASNVIEMLPDTPLQLEELRLLDLSHNRISCIPDQFLIQCSKLEALEAANNKLESLPSEWVAAELVKLGTLKLSNNLISEKEPFFVPKFVLELPNLRILDLAGNRLEGLPPPNMWKTQILKELVVSFNKISKLSFEGARAWSKLEKLHLSRNKISELPKEIGHLSSLQSLDISHNKLLTTLPDDLGRCSCLWEMPLDGLNLDIDFKAGARVRELRMYLHNRLKKAQDYYRMKLMVVGYGGRGKTSLLHALKKKVRQSGESPPVTVGVIVDEWKFERQRNNKTITYTLSTWDFAGQEDFYSTHQCFLSNRTLYLGVYDISLGTDEVDRLKPWLANIHARAPGCPVIIVGTHYDKMAPEDRAKIVSEFDIKLKDLMSKPGFPEIKCSAMVDLTRESNEMDQLRKKILSVIDEYKVRGQPVMGQKVPASYVKLAEVLSEEARTMTVKDFPVLRHNQLMRIIHNENLELDEDELKQAVSFLHESGVLLHYDETALQMRDFYFINPGWLCRMMAQVVTVPEINPFIKRDGIMKRNSAYMLFAGKAIAGDKENSFIFPPNMIPQYLRLLEKFEIALPRNEEELLIPCRLPSIRPQFQVPQLDRKDMVFRFYSMPFVPIGFWSRLLTRLIVFTQSKFMENVLMLGSKPAEVHCWQEGLFVIWKQDTFFMLDGCRGDTEEVHVTVPSSPPGVRLLGYVVDHIDSLVDEWYPGLTSIEPLLGRELLQKFVPCTTCTGKEPHLFLFSDLVSESERSDTVVCPQHAGDVSLSQLAPDVMLTDVESHFRLEVDKFEFKNSPENLLGDGGFGSVYKAVYRGQTVATKVFSAIGDTHPHKMLRQEAIIMRRLKHPSVVSLVAVARTPQHLMLMEFAPGRSLAHVLNSQISLSRTIQHKILLQVAEGMHYLHQLMIVYRDMKPDNVLIFSLSPDAVVNAKISDYGISQFTALSGLVAQEGTYSFRAPEVIRGETYSFQADVFSFGILMYLVLTGGQHPFEELEFKNERDKSFADNRPVPPLIQRGCPPWADMQDLMNQCMHQVPDYRPLSETLCQRLNTAELFCLREVLPVSVGTTVECMAYQEFDDGHNMRLWVASGDNEYMQLTWFSLLDYTDEELTNRNRHKPNGMGTMFRDGRILCVLPVNKEYVLLGTQAGKIWVFNTRNDLLHSSPPLQDSVLCLNIITRNDDSLVLAGLANGKIALYPLSEILQSPQMNPIEIRLGESYEPICCILHNIVDRRLVVSCGTRIIVMDSREGVAVEKMITTDDNSGPASKPILTMACGRLLYLSRRNMTEVEAWDLQRERRKMIMDLSDVFKLQKKESRITSMALHENKVLWVGTGGGHVAMIDTTAWTALTITDRHTASIRSLLSVRLTGPGKYGSSSTSIILSGGLGFKTGPDVELERENQYGCVAVWEADYPQVLKTLADNSNKRRQLLEKLQSQN